MVDIADVFSAKTMCALMETVLRNQPNKQSGFMLAPLLYMLALGGIGAAVMFSGYSQVLRSNAEMTAVNTVRQQLNSAGQTLSASAALDSATSTIVQPPNVQLFSAVTDTSRLPGNYAAVNATGTPHDYGVIDVSSGVRQLDPWGKYYVYCRWENPVSNASAPSIMVISGGPDGLLGTKCGDTAAQGDDRINKLTVAEAINRANVWQVNSSSQVKFGIQADAVKVNDDGSMTAKSLALSTPLAITSGGTGATDAATARTNLSVPSNTGSGASGTWNIDISGNAATATVLQTARNFSIAGATGLTAPTVSFDGSGNVALALTGTLALANGGTGATTAPGARTNLGSTAVGDALFTAASASAGRGTLGATAIGDALFTAATAAAARTTLGLGTMAVQDANNVIITGGTISGVTISSSTINGDINGNASTASSVPATGITGVVSIAQGGTGQTTAGAALIALGGNNASNLTTGTLNSALLPVISPTSAGAYNWGTVDIYGRVTVANNLSTNSISQGNSGVSVSDTGTDGTVTISTEGLARLTIDQNGNVGIGTATPADKLDVNGNIRVRGAAGTDRSLFFSTLSNKRWALSENNVAESGSNLGSNFVITRYDDAGTSLGNALAIARNTGAISTSGDLTIGGAATATGGFFGTFNGTFTGTVAAAGSNGQVQFNNGGNLGADSNFNWNNTTKRLGIGTASPNVLLHVDTGSGTGQNGIQLSSSAAGAGSIYNYFAASNTYPITIYTGSAAGNGGQVQFNNNASATRMIVGNGFVNNPNVSSYGDLQLGIDASNSGTGSFEIAKGNAYGGRIGSDGTSLFKITNAGNVGIGTTAPAAKLDMEGRSFTYTAAFSVGQPQGNYTEFFDFNTYAGMVNIAVDLVEGNGQSYSETYHLVMNYDDANVVVGTVYRILPIRSTGKRTGATTGWGSGEYALEAVKGASTWTLRVRQVGATDQTGSIGWIASIRAVAASGSTKSVTGTDTSNYAYTILRHTPMIVADNKVGIGTANPAANLDIGNTGASPSLRLTGTGSMEFYRPAQSHWKLQHMNNGFAIQNSWTGAGYNSVISLDDGLGIATTPTLRMTYDALGNRVGINTATPAASAVMDLTSTTKGFLMPRVTTVQRDAIASPATGLMVYNTTTNLVNIYNGSAWTVAGNDGTTAFSFPQGTVTAPGLYVTGDSDTGFYQSSANKLSVTAGGTEVMRWNTLASAVNYFSATPAIAGGGPTLAVDGSDTNININLSPKGTGAVIVNPQAAGAVGLAVKAAASQTADLFQIQNSAGVVQTEFDKSGYLGIGTTSVAATALLDMVSTTKGMLIPRMTTAQRNAIATPATGLMVYNTTTNTSDYYNGTSWVSSIANASGGELDPKVGALTANNFCTANAGGTAIVCSTSVIPVGNLGTGTPSSATYLRGDGTWVNTSTIQSLPAGSTGQVQFNNANAFAADAAFNWDNTNKRLGIGTATPIQALHVQGNISSNSIYISDDTAVNQKSRLYMAGGGVLNLSLNGSDVFNATSSAFNLSRPLYMGANKIVINGASGAGLLNINGMGAPQIVLQRNDADFIQGWDATLTTNTFKITGPGGAYFAGNVGIASTTPAYPLDVVGRVASS